MVCGAVRAARQAGVSWHDGDMRLVYLLRHAKSSWESGLPDQERPLAKRGRRAAKAIGRHVREAGVEPELVLCSTARRARETLERVEPALGSPDVRIEPRLYEAGSDELLDCLRAVADHVGSVMLIGHNPGLQQLALDLARPTADVSGARGEVSDGGARDARAPGPQLAPDRAGDRRAGRLRSSRVSLSDRRTLRATRSART